MSTIVRHPSGPKLSDAVEYNGVCYLAGMVASDETLDTKGQTEQVLADAGGEVLLVDFTNHLRPRQRQQLVVALDVTIDFREACTAILGLAQLVALDHGAHRAIQDQDAA